MASPTVLSHIHIYIPGVLLISLDLLAIVAAFMVGSEKFQYSFANHVLITQARFKSRRELLWRYIYITGYAASCLDSFNLK